MLELVIKVNQTPAGEIEVKQRCDGHGSDAEIELATFIMDAIPVLLQKDSPKPWQVTLDSRRIWDEGKQ